MVINHILAVQPLLAKLSLAAPADKALDNQHLRATPPSNTFTTLYGRMFPKLVTSSERSTQQHHTDCSRQVVPIQLPSLAKAITAGTHEGLK